MPGTVFIVGLQVRRESIWKGVNNGGVWVGSCKGIEGDRALLSTRHLSLQRLSSILLFSITHTFLHLDDLPGFQVPTKDLKKIRVNGLLRSERSEDELMHILGFLRVYPTRSDSRF